MANDYLAYGLQIRSDVELPQLRTCDDGSGSVIEIHSGDVAASGIGASTTDAPYLQAREQEVWLNVPDVARFHVRHGTSIIYDSAPGVDEALLRTYLLGSGLGAILIQQGLTVLHGGSVVVDDGSLMCVGPSGAGKSTTSAGFFQRGCRVLADDVSPIDDASHVLSGVPHIKVWSATADALGIATDGLARVARLEDKFLVPLGDSFADVASPLRAVFELCPSDVTRITVEELFGLEKVALVERNLYRPEFVQEMGIRGRVFQRAARRLSGVHAFRVQRPVEGFRLDELLDTVLETYAWRTDASTPNS